MGNVLKDLAEGRIQGPLSVVLGANAPGGTEYDDCAHVVVLHLTRALAVRLLAVENVSERLRQVGTGAHIEGLNLGLFGDSVAWMQWSRRSGKASIYSWCRMPTFATTVTTSSGATLTVQELVEGGDELCSRSSSESIHAALDRDEIAPGVYAGDLAVFELSKCLGRGRRAVDLEACRAVEQAELGAVDDSESPCVHVRWIPQVRCEGNRLRDLSEQAIDAYLPLEAVMFAVGGDFQPANTFDSSLLTHASIETVRAALKHQGPSKVVVVNVDEVETWLDADSRLRSSHTARSSLSM